MSSGFAEQSRAVNGEAVIDTLLRQARLDLDDARRDASGVTPRTPEERDALRKAVETLARALTGPMVERYRYASASHPGVEYEITVDGADVACTCPGFEYRGQCRHARDVKAAIAEGRAAPAGYRGAS
jgi:hypothetical protein